jgi:hypothetical protein
MSTTISPANETLSEHSARVTGEFCAALGLDNVKSKDLPLLTIALVEVATDEVRTGGRLAQRIHAAFQDLLINRPPARRAKTVTAFEALTPVGPVDLTRLRPHGPVDPFALYEAYGAEQARRVLSNMSLDYLKQSASIVEQRMPGTRPTNRRAKASLVAYIMENVAK